jgi:hypothetical protein
MIAYSHLVGAGSLKQFIDSKGENDPADANNVKGSDYLDAFAEHLDVDWSVPEYSAKNTIERLLDRLFGKFKK